MVRRKLRVSRAPESRGHISECFQANGDDDARDSEEEADAHAEELPNLTFCGVCKARMAKYKCAKCYLPNCSVSCSKSHREARHGEDFLDSKVESDHNTRRLGDAPPPLSNYIACTDPTNPTSFITDAPQLWWLLDKYPRLWDQLMVIRDARQPPPGWKPSPIPGLSLRRREEWTYEIGLQRGLEALRRAKEMPGEEGEGVREYVELIKYLTWSARDTEGAHLIQMQTEQDLQAIQNLMSKEARK